MQKEVGAGMFKFGCISAMWFSMSLLFPALLAEATEIPSIEPNQHITLRIYFTPFVVDTFLAITSDDIEQRSVYKIWIVREQTSLVQGPHPVISKLRRMLLTNKGTENIDDNLMRLKVVFPGDEIYVDQKGRVLRKKTGDKFKLSKKQMNDLTKEIEYFSGVVDMIAGKQVFAKEQEKAGQ